MKHSKLKWTPDLGPRIAEVKVAPALVLQNRVAFLCCFCVCCGLFASI
jgi:hypothetical protein